ncbi:unnamed protein product [Mucor hiemalis]
MSLLETQPQARKKKAIKPVSRAAVLFVYEDEGLSGKKARSRLRITYGHYLNAIKNDSKTVPSDVKSNIDALLNQEQEPPTTIVHNYNISGDMVRVPGKQKIYHNTRSKKEGEDEEEEENWIATLSDCESVEDIHKYSPERNGVVRVAPKLDEKKVKVPKGLAKKVKKLLSKENAFNIILRVSIKQSLCLPSHGHSSEEFEDNELSLLFVAGEEELCAMTKQLRCLEVKADHRRIYKADGIVRVSDASMSNQQQPTTSNSSSTRATNNLKKLYQKPSVCCSELMLVETVGVFGKEDLAKISFDNSKGMFALLAMLKTLADNYTFASCESFRKIKLLYLQPSGSYLRLWQLRYKSNGCYEYVRIAKARVCEEKEEGEACINILNDFMGRMIESLTDTLQSVKDLKEEHEKKSLEAESECSVDQMHLSDVICPQIFRISYGKHSRGFGKGMILSPSDD